MAVYHSPGTTIVETNPSKMGTLTTSGSGVAVSQFDKLARIAENWPIPKTTYSNTVIGSLFDAGKKYVKEWIEITGGISLSYEWPNEERNNMILELQQEMDPFSIAFTGSPYAGSRTAGWPDSSQPTYDDDDVDFAANAQAEVDFMTTGLNIMKNTYGLTPDVILISSEAFLYDTENNGEEGMWGSIGMKTDAWPDYVRWNNELVLRWDAIYDAAKAIFASADVSYYNACSNEWWHGGWYIRNNHDPRQKLDAYSMSLYEPIELCQTVQEFEKTLDYADGYGALDRSDLPIIPWIAVGSTYKVDAKGWKSLADRYTYSTDVDWWTGNLMHRNINTFREGLPDWSRATYNVIYPQPFYNNPTFIDHFEMYCKGANGYAI